jgi:hypothetical protein
MSPRGRRRPGPPPTNAAAAHTDWLTLTTPTLPFLSVPVLSAAFPSGPDRLSPGLRAETLNQWDGNEFEAGAAQSTDRTEWVRWILRELLDHGGRVVPGDRFIASGPEASTSITATFAVLDDPDSPDTSPARLLVLVLPAGTSPDGRAGDTWSATWTQRMALLCRTNGCRIGLVTDGDLIRLIWAPEKSSTGHATWRASLFSSERAHLDSLWTVFSARQFFAARADEQPEALLARSEAAEAEVTDTLGRQVRRAVELLVFSLDRAHRDPETPSVLDDLEPAFVYEGAVTVLMRLVFLLAAEENELLPTNNLLFSAQYAISTLRGDLEDSGRFGRERLEQQSSAWHRILATTRVVHGGVNHELLRINPYGGRLFDPDRYPFLEGRGAADDAPWWADAGRPPLVDDLTVLEIMRALQVLRLSATDTRTLSYRNIEVEQIGHVYEGLLDHNAVSSGTATVLGLVGKDGDEPEVRLAELEAKALGGRQALVTFLKGVTKRTPAALSALLDGEPDPQGVLALRTACAGNQTLVDRVMPFIGVLRDDLRRIPMVFPPGAIYVTQTGSRRDSGTAYTSRSLAEELAEHALAPLCYRPGPQDTPNRTEWIVRPSEEILNLKVCDPAVGSGAILVAACRYLADALVEAWIREGVLDRGELTSAGDNPGSNQYRLGASRLVAERCCYGVDRNPIAVEMAKMSFWLTTMARDRPFSYLDHNLRSGDSLIGITELDQIRTLHLSAAYGRARTIGLSGIDPAASWLAIGPLVDEAISIRLDIETTPSDTARDTARKVVLAERADRKVAVASAIADQLIGCALRHADSANPSGALDNTIRQNASRIVDLLTALGTPLEMEALTSLQAASRLLLDRGKPSDAPPRQPLHWPLVFSEVFAGDRTGFDACIGNPPFAGGQKITGASGTDYRRYLVNWVANGARGSADLIAYFFLLATKISRSFALLATNSVAQGDTSEVGLAQIIDAGWTIRRAVSSMKWPGSESLEIAKVWATSDPWKPSPILDGRAVRVIDEMLYQAPRSGWRKRRLNQNEDHSFQGSNILGEGFKMSPVDAEMLIRRNESNREVLFPLLGGEDLNESAIHAAPKWVINFFDWPEERARRYPDCFEIVQDRVKPDREKVTYSEHARIHWWRYERERVELYRRIGSLSRVLATCQTSKVQQPAFVEPRMVFNHKLVIFPYEDDFHFGVLSSMFHWRWVLRFGSTLRTDPVYTPSDVFDTFPQPVFSEAVALKAKALNDLRSRLMVTNVQGLTATYNRFHDPDEKDEALVGLREAHTALDYAICEAYGWNDLLPDLKHGFHQVRLQGERFTFAPDVADEVIDLLLEENKRRYESEVDRGAQPSRRVIRREPGGGTLFDLQDLDEESNANEKDEVQE